MFLNCHTAYSFKYGTLPVEKLFEEAQRCGVHKLILTEINNTASYIEMLRLCEERKPGSPLAGENPYDLEIAVGIEFRQGHELLYVIIAQNNNGFEKINKFLSHNNRENKKLPDPAPEIEDTFVIYPFGKTDPERLRSNEFIGVRKHQLNQFALYTNRKEFPEKFIILHPVTFASKTDFNTHRLLRAIDNNTLLSKLPEHEQAHPEEVMIREEELEHHFRAYPELIRNTKKIIDQCSIHFNLKEDKNKKTVLDSAEADWDFLVTHAWEGFQNRYDANNPELRERFERELNIIKHKGFAAYYLITYDLIRFAKERGFEYVGRGSGANSVVAYC